MTATEQCILLVDDDAAITEGLSYSLEAAGRKIVICSDVDAAEVALSHFPVTHLVTDVQFTGDFGFEGLHFLGRVRTVAPQCRVVLMTGQATDALRRAAIANGASAVLAKPFSTAEIEAIIGRPESTVPSEIIRIPSIDDILAGDHLCAKFQPIVRLTPDGISTVAFEALMRVRGSWLPGGPAMLFEYAQRRGKLAELNILAMTRSFEEATTLPTNAAIFINIDPLTFTTPRLASTLFEVAARSGVALDRVVLEITERSGFVDDKIAGAAFDALREAGVRFALDDHGSAYSHLSQINRIRPSFIKISNTFGTGFEQDETKERIVRHTLALARDFGCETILEGIESGETVRAAVDAGVPLAQGFHFSRARAASHWGQPAA
ncbi:MAG TPA: EAL domain-containing response regulator [Thermoanaerobaculia bacterium]|nr:EAL domain-containing response regulator [Thermoanaerobaculia bacterium]